MKLVEHSVPACKLWLGWDPFGVPPRHLFARDQKVQFACWHIQLNKITIPHHGQRTTNKRFGGHMQNAGSIACTTHSRIRDANHIADPRLNSFSGIGSCPHSGIPGAPTGPALCRTSTELAVTSNDGSSIRAAISL